MSDKAYKKIYVNGDCVVDFTQQTSNEYNVSPLQTVFNQKGELVTGKDDFWLFGSDAYILGSAYEICGYLKDPIIYLNNPECNFSNSGYFNLASFSSGMENGSFKKYATTVFLSEINLIKLLDYRTVDTQSSFNIVVPTVKNLTSAQLDALHRLSAEAGMQIFIMDTKPVIDTVTTGWLIYNCSDICRTDDGVFSYVKADGKAYILGIYADALNQMLASSNNVLVFPDTLEGLPVIGLGGCILKSRFFSDSWTDITISDIQEIHLPNQLEIIGTQSFQDRYPNGGNGKMILPRTLHTLLYNSTSNSWDYPTFGSAVEYFYELSLEPAEDGICYLPENLNTSSEIFDSLIRGLTLTSGSLYIPTPTNPYYVYTGSGEESTAVVILEGCNYTTSNLSNDLTSVTFPSTLKSIPKISYRFSLTAINFADSIAATEIPYQFADGCSKLTSIAIPEGITKISSQAFYACDKLANITLPSTLTSIDSNAFYEGSGKTLSKVIQVKAQTPPTLYSTTSLAYNTSNISKIIVPKNCLNVYKTAANWKTWATKMEESTEW